jgi:hypothetical protein
MWENILGEQWTAVEIIPSVLYFVRSGEISRRPSLLNGFLVSVQETFWQVILKE